jgi:hypothetical protein
MVRSDAARLEQRRLALRAANEARSYRREVKERLAAGELAVAEVLVDPRAARMTVGDVLFALPGVGRVKREKVLRWAACSPFKEVGELTPNGRSRLLRGLALHGGQSS